MAMILEYATAVVAGLLLLLVARRQLYFVFVLIVLLTEFYYINVGAGVARPYHFVSVLVIAALARHLPKIGRSRVFQMLLVLASVSLLSVAMSPRPLDALASFSSLLANISVAVAVALVLVSGRIQSLAFKRTIYFATVISVIWGIMQVAGHGIGLDLSLSAEQASQVNAGFGPAFRTEANAFGKFMTIPFFFFLADYVAGKARGRIAALLFAAILAGIVISFTRTAIYGMGVASVYVAFWYAKQRQFTSLTARATIIGLVAASALVLMASGGFGASEYAIYKLDNFFNKAEVLEGGSSAYRLEAMRLVIESAFSNQKQLLFGNGWGQTHAYLQGVEVQAGGGDVVNMLGYSGLLGVLSYLTVMLAAFIAAQRVSRQRRNEDSVLAVGAMFSLVALFVTGQLAGYLIAPEFWLLLGLCIYLERSARLFDSIGDVRSSS